MFVERLDVIISKIIKKIIRSIVGNLNLLNHKFFIYYVNVS